MPPTFLRPARSYNHVSQIDGILDAQYADFQAQFIHQISAFLGVPIKINFTSSGYRTFCQTFWHLISRDRAGDKTQRDVEPLRAMRVHWIKPLTQNHNHNELSYFTYQGGEKYLRHYIWERDEDYIVVLEQKPSAFFLITAFVIDSDHKRRETTTRLNKFLAAQSPRCQEY